MDAGLGSNPSYVWRSLIWSREILANGLLWRVGDGKSINIFKEKWIPSMQSHIGNPLIPWEQESTVNALIREGAWDVNLISTTFNTYVAEEILKIPLPTTPTEDSQYWRFDDKGRYSVKSGCRLQRGLFVVPEHQTEYPDAKWWSFLWNLSLPPKIRMFWWCVSHDCIPTNLNLVRHHVIANASCDLCGHSSDSTCHALFFCHAIKHLWKGTSFDQKLKEARRVCTMDLCLWMKAQLDTGEFEDFATHTWAIWKEKQTFRHGERKQPISEHITWSSKFLSDFRDARKRVDVPKEIMMEQSEKVWTPPDERCLKLNVDASVNTNLNHFSVGGVVRDHQGRLLLAFGKQINQPISVVHGELLAIWEGVKLLFEKNFRDVQVETYSLLAVQAVMANQENLSYEGRCAEDIRITIQKPVVSELFHVLRSANKVAHKIAYFASSSPSPFVWMNGEFPS